MIEFSDVQKYSMAEFNAMKPKVLAGRLLVDAYLADHATGLDNSQKLTLDMAALGFATIDAFYVANRRLVAGEVSRVFSFTGTCLFMEGTPCSACGITSPDAINVVFGGVTKYPKIELNTFTLIISKTNTLNRPKGCTIGGKLLSPPSFDLRWRPDLLGVPCWTKVNRELESV
jgi:hypothetical protein